MLILLELGILALIAWPFLRATIHPGLRRAFPQTAAIIAFVVLLGSASVVGIALWWPTLLHILTLLAAGGALYALVRMRPAYGRARCLPPGSLSWLPFDYLMDPFFFQRCFERYGDIFKVNQFGIGAGPNPLRGLLQPVCCVNLKRGIKILHEHDERLIPPPIPSSRFIPKKYLREMEHDDHRRYRRIFSAAFLPEVIDESTAFIAQHFRMGLQDIADRSAANGTRGVAPEPIVLEMTFGVFARCFLGMFPSDARFGRLRELVDVIDLANRDAREVTRALEDIARILHEEAHRSVAGGESLPSSFLGEIAHREPGAFEDVTALRNFIYIMQASWIGAAGLVVWLFKELSEHPEWCKRLSRLSTGKRMDGNR
jgi:cytochrome P450